MIEINLVPDVKRELIRAQRVRLTVISLASLASIIAIGAIVVLGLLYGVEAVRGGLLDNSIKSDSAKLSNVSDINKTLTLQNQLTMISQLHDSSHVNSRIFSALIPASEAGTPNQVSYTTVTTDTSQNTITIAAQTPQYSGLDAFKKTLAAMQFQFTTKGNKQVITKPLASNIQITNQTLGADANNSIVVTFNLTFQYPVEFLSPSSQGARITTPSATNATDSYQGIPTSLFTDKATTTTGGGN